MKNRLENKDPIKALLSYTRQKEATVSLESTQEILGRRHINERHLDLEVIMKMMPKSDDKQFIGNEYFLG